MRVLHVVASGQRRGAEIFASDLVGALAGSGVSQRVVLLRDGMGTTVPYEAETSVVGSGGWRAPGTGIEVAAVRRLRAIIDGWSPDIVQAHGGEPFKYAVLASANRPCPVVYRKIGSTPPRIARGLRRAAHGRLIRRAARVVAVADAVRRETLEVFRLPDWQVVTIPNAVDARRVASSADRASVRSRLGIPSDAGVVLSLGALTWEKDPMTHLRAMAPVLARHGHAMHLIAGHGPLRTELETAVQRLALQGRVRLLGSRSDVSDLLVAADVLLFASRTEGMPAIVIEAGMAGLAVAGYAVAGAAEVVEPDVTGLLVSRGNLPLLTAAVSTLLEDHARRTAMGRAARARCLADFDIRLVAPRYLRLYETLSPGPDGA